ncbi:MAG: GNAT family N-acetyltransferase [Chloroflexi bacterium]|nr:GNAT family N-acetyltransferase [Chloroflexota bacterium]
MDSMLSLVPVETEQQKLQACTLIEEYLQWINQGAQREYGIQFDIDSMIAADLSDEKFNPPFGRFYLVESDGQTAGVGCLKRIDQKVAEIQRMYIRPEFRGKKIGRLLVERLIADARDIGYQKLRLESLKFLTTAHTLYRSVGFQDIDPYAGNSMRNYQVDEIVTAYQANAVFMEMDL